MNHDKYYMDICRVVATKSTCKIAVGSVIVGATGVLSTGFNGSPPGKPHCSDVGCIDYHGHCLRTVHSEENALMRAALTHGNVLYSTHLPCILCCKLIITMGIKEVVYHEFYHDDRCKLFDVSSQIEYLTSSGIIVRQLCAHGGEPCPQSNML